MSKITFEAPVIAIGSWTLLVLPKNASSKLPSRGMVLVEGTVNNYGFKTALEPDGRGSHWLTIDTALSEGANIDAGDTVRIAINSSSDWPEPNIPADLKKALSADKQVQGLWEAITPMARWDWIRWISSTGQAETRKRRIETAFSKLKAGSRRPCCFNRSLCTVPAVSKNGALLVPSPVTK